MKFRVLALTVVVGLLTPAIAAAQTPGACQFILGFRTLHDLDSDDVGECLSDQTFVANGDAQQPTTKGLMVWRKADNWTAFTNGYMTWINGPNGLVSRLNTDRFDWEAPPPPIVGGAPSSDLVRRIAQQMTGGAPQSTTIVFK